MDRRDYLKPIRFGNAEKRRLVDTKNLKQKRSIRRTTNFNLRRDIDDVEEVNEAATENISPKRQKILDRKLALQKFRLEKEAQKKALQAKKKPPFIVGIPHHGSSPLLRDSAVDRSKKAPKGASLHEFSFQPNTVPQSTKKLTSPHTPTVLKRSVKKPLKNVSNLVHNLNINLESTHSYDVDEVLAVPLDETKKKKEVAIGRTKVTQIRTEVPENILSPTVLETTNVTEAKESDGKVIDLKDEDDNNKVTNDQVVYEQLNQNSKVRRSSRRSHLHDTNDNLPSLPEPKKVVTGEKDEQEVAAVGEAQTKNERMSCDGEDNELTREVAFQHRRVQAETTRLLELADQWQAVVLHERVPQEVVDEVDSLVGQTRLLTSDKFQQFRRLIPQYEKKTGTHPVTLDDLNGFWDMVYLQVESLDKKYASLDVLKHNNWVRPEPPASKKKRRTTKALKVNKVTETTYKKPLKRENLVLPPEDQQPQTPTAGVIPINGVLLSRKRKHSNSPSPYIAMRLSGISRSMSKAQDTDGTPRSLLIQTAEAQGSPKSSLKNSLKKLTNSTRKRISQLSTIPSVNVEIEEDFEQNELMVAEESLVPVFTPRRSTRLLTKMQTPVMCSACDRDVTSCERLIPELTLSKEKDIKKPSTSGLRFSLRPSILTLKENKNETEIPKKSIQTEKQNAERSMKNAERKSRRSTRPRRKVTFESEAERKAGFNFPATPYKKNQEDS